MMPVTGMKPAWEITTQNKTIVRNQIISDLENRVTRELAMSPEKLVCRSILPWDLGLDRWKTPALKALCSTIYSSGIIRDQTFLCIYKIIQCSDRPSVSTVTFQVRGADKLIANLSELYGLYPLLKEISKLDVRQWLLTEFGDLNEVRMEGWFPTAVVMPQNCDYKIYVESPTDSDGDNIVLAGIVIEPRGRKLLP